MKWIPLALYLICSVTLAVVTEVAPSCPTRLALLQRSTVLPGSNYFQLPPNSERRLLYAIVEDDQGAYFLAVIGYRGRHKQIDIALSIMQDLDEMRAFKYVAMGELVLQNSDGEVSAGIITSANEVAGFYGEVLSGLRGAQNNVEWAVSQVRKHAPWMSADSPKTLRFTKSEMHLFPELDAFIHKIESLKKQELLPSYENYRHYLGNLVARAFAKAQTMKIAAQKKGKHSDEEHIKGLREIVTDPLTNQALRLYIRWAQNDGEKVPFSESVIQGLEKCLNQKLSPAEWVKLGNELEIVIDAIMDLSDEARLTASVQVVKIRPATSIQVDDFD